MVPAPRGTTPRYRSRFVQRPGSGEGRFGESGVFFVSTFESSRYDVMMNPKTWFTQMSRSFYVRARYFYLFSTWHHSRARAQPSEMAALEASNSAPAHSVHASTSKEAAPFLRCVPRIESRSTRRAPPSRRERRSSIISSDTRVRRALLESCRRVLDPSDASLSRPPR